MQFTRQERGRDKKTKAEGTKKKTHSLLLESIRILCAVNFQSPDTLALPYVQPPHHGLVLRTTQLYLILIFPQPTKWCNWHWFTDSTGSTGYYYYYS